MKDIVAAGYAGETGAVRLSQERRELILTRFREDYADRMCRLYPNIPDRTELERYAESPDDISEIGEGGALTALYDMLKVRRCGCRIERKKIPVRQTTIEICELLGLDPYRLEGRGYVILTDDGEKLENDLRARGYPAGCIGRLSDDLDKLIIDHPDKIEYLSRNYNQKGTN